ncbi:MAG: hypothetical protein H7340_00170, partial [Variovorax sp.]|nr:hypothetical protein [Variovorax sp.]
GFRVAARRSAVVDTAHGSSGSRDTGERNESWREFELDWQLGDVAGRLRLKIGPDCGLHATGKKTNQLELSNTEVHVSEWLQILEFSTYAKFLGKNVYVNSSICSI